MSKLDKEQVIAKFTEAYTAANGKAPEIEAAGGWYSVDGGKKMRLAALDEMANELAGGAAPAKQAEAAPKAESKPATKAKPAAKAKPKKAGSFSVKAYWIEQVEARNPGSRSPR